MRSDWFLVLTIPLAIMLGFGMAHINLGKAVGVEITRDNTSWEVVGLDSEAYTFVLKEGMTQEQYMKTMLHEACHDFIRRDHYHFCEYGGFINED